MNTPSGHDGQTAPAVPASTAPPLTRYEWALLCSAYISQCVAFSFFFVALSSILRGNGAELADLSFIYLLGVAPALKFLWAPLMDRYGFGRWGHYSRWLVLMQTALIVTLWAMAQLKIGGVPPELAAGATGAAADMNEAAAALGGAGGTGAAAHPPLPWTGLMLGCLAMSFFTACQDMAADGLSTRLLSPSQRGLGNALQMACGSVGFIAGGGGVLALYEYAGWQTALMCLTLLNVVTLVLALFYREPAHARPDVVVRERMLDYWREIGRFWVRPDTGWRWAFIIVMLQAGVYMAYSVMSPMLVDAGWSFTKIGQVANGYGTALGMASMIGFGWLLRHWSVNRVLHVILPAQVVGVLLLAIPLLLKTGALGAGLPEIAQGAAAAGGTAAPDGAAAAAGQAAASVAQTGGIGDIWITLGVAGFMMCYMPMGVLVSTLMMGRSSAHAPATDFSVQYGLYLAAGYGAGALGLPLAQRMGYAGLLALAGAVCVLMAVLIPVLHARLGRPPSAATARA